MTQYMLFVGDYRSMVCFFHMAINASAKFSEKRTASTKGEDCMVALNDSLNVLSAVILCAWVIALLT